MENKTNKGLVWLVVVLIVLVVALMGSIVYREFYSEDKIDVNNSMTPTNAATKVEQDKKTAEKYFNIFTQGFEGFCGSEEIVKNGEMITINNLPNEYKSKTIYWYLINNEMFENSSEFMIEDDKIDLHKILIKDINEASLELFGIKNHSFKEEDLDWIALEKTTDNYYYFSKFCSGCENYVSNIELKNYEFNDTKLNLRVYQYSYETNSETDEKLDDTFKSSEYQIILNRINNNYVFESISLVN